MERDRFLNIDARWCYDWDAHNQLPAADESADSDAADDDATALVVSSFSALLLSALNNNFSSFPRPPG